LTYLLRAKKATVARTDDTPKAKKAREGEAEFTTAKIVTKGGNESTLGKKRGALSLHSETRPKFQTALVTVRSSPTRYEIADVDTTAGAKNRVHNKSLANEV
jgi:hypothetical protein